MHHAFFKSMNPVPQFARCWLPLVATAVGLFLAVSSTWAEVPKTEIEVGGSYDQLSNEFDSWSSFDLEALHVFSRHKKLTGGLRRITRFGKSDTEFAIGSYYPLTESLVGRIEFRDASPGEVLPQQTLFLGAQQVLGDGWVIHGAYRHQKFEQGNVNAFIVRGEIYFSEYRADFTVTQARLDTGQTALGLGTSLSRYYGNRSSINVILSSGEEIEKVTRDQIARFDVFAVAFWGRHWISETWGVTYGVRYREQGDLYQLVGINVGVRHGF